MQIQRRGGSQLLGLLRRFGINAPGTEGEIDDRVIPTAEIPRLDNLCGGSASVAGSASDRSIIQLRNPAASGVTVILHRLWVSLATAGVTTLRLHDPALATLPTTLAVLRRTLGSQPSPSGQIRTATADSAGTRILLFNLDIADRTYEFDLSRLGNEWDFTGISLAEGRGVVMTPATDNILQDVSFLWSERIIE